MAAPVHGIVHDSAGRYVMATLSRAVGGVRRVRRITRWNGSAVLSALRLRGMPAALGAPAVWRSLSGAGDEPPDAVEAIRGGGPYRPRLQKTEIDLIERPVRANIARIVPDDLFLSAVPLHFEPNCPSSFVAIWRGPDSVLAGVTVHRALTAVFHFPCGDDDTGALTAHIGRLRRYWNRQHPRQRFPDTLFVIGEAEAHIDEPVAVKRVTVTQNGVEVVDPAALRAIGAALSLDSDFGPVFREAAPEAAYLRSRAALLAVSGVVLIATICAWGGLAAANAWHRRTLDQAQQHYRELITTNADIKSMLAKSNTLARRIMLIERQRTLRTSWGRFLDAIGKRRPTDLYIERIGSQPDERNPDMVTVKLAGWSKSESSITSFMGALQSTARVSKPELASMTRDAKQKSTTRFLIVCTLKLTAK